MDAHTSAERAPLPAEPNTHTRTVRIARTLLACLAWLFTSLGPARPAAALDAPAVFDSAVSAIRHQFFDPRLNGASLDTIAAYRRLNLAGADSEGALVKQVRGLLSDLKYSGTSFYREGQAPDFTPAFRWRMTRDGLVVTAVQTGSECWSAGLAVGDLVSTRPDDLWGPRGSRVALSVRSSLGEWSREIQREGYDVPEPDFSLTLHAGGKVGCLRVNRLTDPAAVDQVAQEVLAPDRGQSFQDLVLDVRYCRSSDASVLKLLARFAPQASVAGYAVNRLGMDALKEPLEKSIPHNLAESTGDGWTFYPTLSEKGLLALRVLPVPDSTFQGRVMVLADENTRGFAELVPAWFRQTWRGKVGVGGLPAAIKLDGGWTLQLPTTALFLPDGRPLEHHGVEPDAFTEWHQVDVRAAADPDLERALQLLGVEY